MSKKYQEQQSISMNEDFSKGLINSISELEPWQEEGVDFNFRDNTHDCMLKLAVIQNKTEIINFLLAQQDIDLDCGANSSQRPIFFALLAKDFKLAEQLIEQGSDINKYVGISMLSEAIAYRRADIVEFLIQNKASTNQPLVLKTIPFNKFCQPDSPLTQAIGCVAGKEQVAMIELLINQGKADVNYLASAKSKAAIEYAKALDNQELVEFLEEKASENSISKVANFPNIDKYSDYDDF